MNQIIPTNDTDLCKHCGLPWNEHNDSWKFNSDLIIKNMTATKTLDSLKHKKREQGQYEQRLKIVKKDIDNLMETNDVHYKLMAKKKEIEYKKLELVKLDLDTFFSEIDVEDLEKQIDDFNEYEINGIDLLKKENMTFLTLDQILNEDLYAQYLQYLIEKYKNSCQKLLHAESALKSHFTFLNFNTIEYNFTECKIEYENIIRKIELLLCKISITNKYMEHVLKVNGYITQNNDATFFSAGALLQGRIEQDRQICIENSQANSVIQNAFCLENGTEENKRKGFFNAMMTGFGLFDAPKKPAANTLPLYITQNSNTSSSNTAPPFHDLNS
jgi:hypothetical protein